MAVTTVVKTIGTGGAFATLQLWNDGAPANLVTAERSNCGTFAVAAFQQGESLTFVGSGATGKFLDTDSTGVGTGTYVTYGIVSGDPATSDVITGGTSGATAILTSGTANFVGIIWQGQCKNQEFTSAGTLLTVSGSTSSAACYKELTTAAGASFGDNSSVLINPLRYNALAGAGLTSSVGSGSVIVGTEGSFRISKLQVKATGAGSRAASFSGLTQVIDRCIFEGNVLTAGSAAGTILIGAGATPTFSNCVITQTAPGADHVVGTGTGSPNFYNCTIVAASDCPLLTSVLVSGASGTLTIQNCGLFAGDSTKAIHTGSGTPTFTTCVSDISGTAGVTQVTYFNEYEGMSRPDLDFRLSRTSQQIDTGTTDSTHAATDIVGTSRPQQSAYDMGAWESSYTSSSGSATPTRQRVRRGRAHDAESKRKH